jgi:hypothetical protein
MAYLARPLHSQSNQSLFRCDTVGETDIATDVKEF